LLLRYIISLKALAVGAGFGDFDYSNGFALTVGIAIHNMPEGLAVALALTTEKASPSRAFFIALLTGLVEPVGAIIGLVNDTNSKTNSSAYAGLCGRCHAVCHQR
jgi:zinc transporter ZupT